MIAKNEIIRILTNLSIPKEVARDLVTYFLNIQKELKINQLEKSSAGKFVETIVQLLQHLDPTRQDYDKSVKGVDSALSTIYEKQSINNIPTDSRIAICRIARSIYTLRNKRSIIHKNGIDPTIFDLEMIYHASQWIMTELIRLANNCSMSEARTVISDIQKPIVPSVEIIMGRPLVLNTKLKTKDEILVLLYSSYNEDIPLIQKEIVSAMDRKSQSSISKSLKDLWREKFIEGSNKTGYRLTLNGLHKAREIIELMNNN